ncbi:putative angiopoietin-1 receptor-like [Apostichopus japonicus]|uniref:Putative angiopoietin-1 receptor-like n=1 Tax=Stichopus japonicus TaxID=307972 RepID=A0A2G8JZE9_STIJA|nr:putative angiopoietin-1 receptor-like [Apostichopus japonicus]
MSENLLIMTVKTGLHVLPAWFWYSRTEIYPQSSVEIKCILEGSTAVVNRLQIRLSRSEQMIDEHGITQRLSQTSSTNRREVTYRVTSVSEDDQFFCILSLGASIVGSINVTGFVYKLPFISDPPTEVTRTTTSVTITWRPWDEETDVGDPPVVAYIPYYKMDPSQDWMNGSRIQADQKLKYTASSLESDRNYTFSVAAVREGEGGEGPRGPAVTIKTSVLTFVLTTLNTACCNYMYTEEEGSSFKCTCKFQGYGDDKDDDDDDEDDDGNGCDDGNGDGDDLGNNDDDDDGDGGGGDDDGGDDDDDDDDDDGGDGDNVGGDNDDDRDDGGGDGDDDGSK